MPKEKEPKQADQGESEEQQETKKRDRELREEGLEAVAGGVSKIYPYAVTHAGPEE